MLFKLSFPAHWFIAVVGRLGCCFNQWWVVVLMSNKVQPAPLNWFLSFYFDKWHTVLYSHTKCVFNRHNLVKWHIRPLVSCDKISKKQTQHCTSCYTHVMLHHSTLLLFVLHSYVRVFVHCISMVVVNLLTNLFISKSVLQLNDEKTPSMRFGTTICLW